MDKGPLFRIMEKNRIINSIDVFENIKYSYKFGQKIKMTTIQIEIKSNTAMSILKGLEKANIIRLIRTKKKVAESPVNYKGSITRERAVEMVRNIEKSGAEWDERAT